VQGKRQGECNIDVRVGGARLCCGSWQGSRRSQLPEGAMLCGSGGAPGVRPGRAKRQAARCQRTVLVAHTIVAGVRLTASVPLLESARRIRVASADAQGYLRRFPWA